MVPSTKVRLFPILDQDDVDSAKRLIGKAPDPAGTRACILAKCKAKGLTALQILGLPTDRGQAAPTGPLDPKLAIEYHRGGPWQVLDQDAVKLVALAETTKQASEHGSEPDRDGHQTSAERRVDQLVQAHRSLVRCTRTKAEAEAPDLAARSRALCVYLLKR